MCGSDRDMLKNDKLCVIVGAGGIGSNLFQKLTRYAPLMWDILLIDGDAVEHKNIMRQMFTSEDVEYNKASCLTRKANNVLQERNYAYTDYLNTNESDGAKKLVELTEKYPEVVLFGCVDNQPARRQMEKYFELATDKELMYIDAANAEVEGDVVSVYRNKEKIDGVPRSMYDASVLFDTDGDPNDKSCTDQLDEGNIQTLIANDKAAIIALEVFESYLDNKIKTGLWRFDECVNYR